MFSRVFPAMKLRYSIRGFLEYPLKKRTLMMHSNPYCIVDIWSSILSPAPLVRVVSPLADLMIYLPERFCICYLLREDYCDLIRLGSFVIRDDGIGKHKHYVKLRYVPKEGIDHARRVEDRFTTLDFPKKTLGLEIQGD